MPQAKQTDAQRLKELEESTELLEKQGFKPRRGVMIEDDPDGLDEFWSERVPSSEQLSRDGSGGREAVHTVSP